MTEVKIAKKELSQDFKDEFIKNLQGKDFILYGGLVSLAHSKGFKGIRTDVVQAPHDENGGVCIVHAVAVDGDGNEWHGIGDADDSNCNKKVAAHKIRMAETRAKGRALRDALGIDMVMDSELTDPYEKEVMTQHQAKTLKRVMADKVISKEEVSDISFELFGIKSATRLLKEQADILIAELELLDDLEEAEDEKVVEDE